VFDPDREDQARMESHQIHSWGVDERVAWDEARGWIDEGRASGRPFVLDYFTNVTHHPYGAPGDNHDPFPGDDRQSQYQSALHFTDRVVGEIVADLEVRGLRDDTIIVITGDHGQAFGDRHRGNITHKNHLYEENVRELLIVADPRLPAPVRSRRIGSTGDILPTTAALMGLTLGDVPGRDLLADEHSLELVYFHKIAAPGRWGLRDGRWKFTAQLDGGAPELYDLKRDPLEQDNRAGEHPQQVDTYRELCSAWYFQTNAQFLAHVEGAPSAALQHGPDDLRVPGPKAAVFGRTDLKGKLATGALVPSQRVRADVVWVASGEPQSITVRWESPTGRRHDADMVLDRDWSRTSHRYAGPMPMERGRWHLVLLRDGRELLRAHFDVRNKP
jgi:hypothetical protein